MEELSAAGQAATEEIDQLKEDMGCEVVTRLSREEEVVQLGGSWRRRRYVEEGFRATIEGVCAAKDSVRS